MYHYFFSENVTDQTHSKLFILRNRYIHKLNFVEVVFKNSLLIHDIINTANNKVMTLHTNIKL